MISVRVLPYGLQNTKMGLRFRSPFFIGVALGVAPENCLVFRPDRVGKPLSLNAQTIVCRLDIHIRRQITQLGCEIHVDREIM